MNHTHGYAAFWLVKDQLAASSPVWEDVVPLIHTAISNPPSSAPSSCHQITSPSTMPVTSDYAPPYNVLTSAKELLIS
ncbi:hypothetical protein L0Y46_01770, partial [bacterium]|nr:hypothetical protein [bacterium]